MYRLKYWAGNKGPWTDFARHDPKHVAPDGHKLADPVADLDQAVAYAKERTSEHPTTKYPLGVFEGDRQTPVVVVEGDKHKFPLPAIIHYTDDRHFGVADAVVV